MTTLVWETMYHASDSSVDTVCVPALCRRSFAPSCPAPPGIVGVMEARAMEVHRRGAQLPHQRCPADGAYIRWLLIDAVQHFGDMPLRAPVLIQRHRSAPAGLPRPEGRPCAKILDPPPGHVTSCCPYGGIHPGPTGGISIQVRLCRSAACRPGGATRDPRHPTRSAELLRAACDRHPPGPRPRTRNGSAGRSRSPRRARNLRNQSPGAAHCAGRSAHVPVRRSRGRPGGSGPHHRRMCAGVGMHRCHSGCARLQCIARTRPRCARLPPPRKQRQQHPKQGAKQHPADRAMGTAC